MSADLWKEFGSSNQELLKNPWCQSDINLDPVKNGTGLPTSLLLTDLSGSRTESNTDASSSFFAHIDSTNQARSAKSISQQLPTELSPPDGYDFTEQVSTTNNHNSVPRRTSESKGTFQTTTEPSSDPRSKTSSIQADAQAIDVDDEWGDFVGELGTDSADPRSVEDNDLSELKSSLTIQNPLCLIPPLDEFGSSKGVRPASTSNNSITGNLENSRRPPVKGPPPSNVPPPSILLLLISSIFQSLSAELKSYNLQVGPSSHSLDQQVVTRLRRRLANIRASAHIIAGRKLRWSRDGYLSQSMKIGPAHGGRTGGMKLTVLDKTEARREDREVGEAIQVWKHEIGGLRAFSAALRSQFDFDLAIPELAEKMPIRVAKFSDGGMIAARSCFLCGLKRDERVDKVDIQVEDSFEEWWIDHWGHADCVLFWEEQKDHLQQR